MQLQTDMGQSFASQDECVSYGAQGGSLFHPIITQTTGITGVTQNAPFCLLFGHVGDGWCVDILGSGFHPNSPLTVTESVNGGPPFLWSPGAHTDATGSFQFVILNACGRGNLGQVFALA